MTYNVQEGRRLFLRLTRLVETISEPMKLAEVPCIINLADIVIITGQGVGSSIGLRTGGVSILVTASPQQIADYMMEAS